MNTTRLTMAQALVRFLDMQYVCVDGKEEKFVRGIMGIFGHGNVVGLGQASAARCPPMQSPSKQIWFSQLEPSSMTLLPILKMVLQPMPVLFPSIPVVWMRSN